MDGAPAKTEKPAEKPAEEKQETPRFSVEDILDNARALTGRSRHFLAGALHGTHGKLTAAQAKKKADEFAKRPVAPTEEEQDA